MKINDILEMIEPTVSDVNFSGKLVQHPEPRWNPDNDKKLGGRGNFSTVRPDKKDPHMVRKNHHSPIMSDIDDQDGYIPFINHLIRHKLMGEYINLPRVYDVKKITDREGDYIYSYTIEKLIDGKNVSIEELNTIIDRTLGDEPAKGMSWSSREESSVKPKILNQWFGAQIEYGLTNGFYNIKDEELIKALKLIDFVNDRNPNNVTDIHGGNIMYRRTPHGLQLVISDPLA